MSTILVGTSKGLVVFQEEDKEWKVKAMHFQGFPVSMIFVDERTGRWWLGLAHRHWGCKLHYSDNEGDEWTEAKVPTFGDAKKANGEQAKLLQIWCMQKGGNKVEDGLWMGVEPGALFYSQNNGDSFELVESLWNHPSHLKEELWFGAGTINPVIHSIEVNPQNFQHLYLAISCAGIFESKDKGETWTVKNEGLVADYLPNPAAKIGHDPHALCLHPKDPKVLWQQNHCGVFYTKDGGELWQDVSGENKFPYFGFALALEEENPAVAYVIPVESEVQRTASNFQLQVLKTADFGQTWKSQSEGLPKQFAFDIVLRQAFSKKKDLLAFGTNNGNLYVAKEQEGNLTWLSISNHLPKVTNVLLV